MTRKSRSGPSLPPEWPLIITSDPTPEEDRTDPSADELDVSGARIEPPRLEGNTLVLVFHNTVLSHEHPANPRQDGAWYGVEEGVLTFYDVTLSTREVYARFDGETWGESFPVTDIKRANVNLENPRKVVEWEAAFMTDGSSVSGWRIEFGHADFRITKPQAQKLRE